MVTFRLSRVLATSAALLGTACSMPVGPSDVIGIKAEVRRDLSVDCTIKSMTMNGSTTVTVYLEGLPAAPAPVVKSKVVSAVMTRAPSAKVVVFAKL
jgi:hypothetical protein